MNHKGDRAGRNDELQKQKKNLIGHKVTCKLLRLPHSWLN